MGFQTVGCSGDDTTKLVCQTFTGNTVRAVGDGTMFEGYPCSSLDVCNRWKEPAIPNVCTNMEDNLFHDDCLSKSATLTQNYDNCVAAFKQACASAKQAFDACMATANKTCNNGAAPAPNTPPTPATPSAQTTQTCPQNYQWSATINSCIQAICPDGAVQEPSTGKCICAGGTTCVNSNDAGYITSCATTGSTCPGGTTPIDQIDSYGHQNPTCLGDYHWSTITTTCVHNRCPDGSEGDALGNDCLCDSGKKPCLDPGSPLFTLACVDAGSACPGGSKTADQINSSAPAAPPSSSPSPSGTKCSSGYEWSMATNSCIQSECPEYSLRDSSSGACLCAGGTTCVNLGDASYVAACAPVGASCPEGSASFDQVNLSAPINYSAQALKPKATITSIDGNPDLIDVQIVSADGSARDAHKGDQLLETDRIRTGYNTSVTLSFANANADVTMDQLSEFKIAIFRLGNIKQVELALKAGQIQADVKKEAAARTEFVAKSGNSAASVRDTIFIMRVNSDNSTEVLVNEGTVLVNQIATNDNILVGAGKKISVNNQMALGTPTKMTAQDQARFSSSSSGFLTIPNNLKCFAAPLGLLLLVAFASLKNKETDS